MQINPCLPLHRTQYGLSQMEIKPITGSLHEKQPIPLNLTKQREQMRKMHTTNSCIRQFQIDANNVRQIAIFLTRSNGNDFVVVVVDKNRPLQLFTCFNPSTALFKILIKNYRPIGEKVSKLLLYRFVSAYKQ